MLQKPAPALLPRPCLQAVVSLGLLGLLWPSVAAAQDLPSPGALRFQRHLDVQVLASPPAEGEDFRASFRGLLQQRLSLRRSLHLSALLLQTELSHTWGALVGGSLGYRLGPLVIEPFLEGGAGRTDGRVERAVLERPVSGGAPVRRPLYSQTGGTVALIGSGLGATVPLGARFVGRIVGGYWLPLGDGAGDRGRALVGMSLGLGQTNPVWYRRQTDRTPPRIRLLGRHSVVRDSLDLGSGPLTVAAADESGIRRIVVDGRRLRPEVSPAPRPEPLAVEGAYSIVSVELEPWLEGRPVTVTVEDEGRQRASRTVVVFGGPDTEPPILTSTTAGLPETVASWPIRVGIDDTHAGIADAYLGRCPMTLVAPELDRIAGLDVSGARPLHRWASGWATLGTPDALLVRDRVGNTSTIPIDPPRPERIPSGATPTFTRLEATGSRDAAGAWVRVEGLADDPGGGQMGEVSAAGRAFTLAPGGMRSSARFGGWVRVEGDASSIQVVARTLDGRTTSLRADVQWIPASGASSLHVLVLASHADSVSEAERSELERWVRRGDGSGTVEVVDEAATAADALDGLADRLGPGDVLWVHIQGRVVAHWSAPGPSLALGEGSLSFRFLGDRIRRVPAGVTFVSTGLSTSRSWRVLPRRVPGASAPGSCFELGHPDVWGPVPIGDASVGQVVEALGEEVDQNRDGSVSVEEVVRHLRPSVFQGGAVPFDPSVLIPLPLAGR